jgi:cob(I)alamin adenosyltransferase
VSGVADWERGYVQVYTGDGKGKTTAAFGLALRAAGAGLRVFLAQFVKGMEYSELRALERFDEIEVRRYGRDCFIQREPEAADIEAARAGLAEARTEMASGNWDLVILDEANIATHFELFSVEDLLEAIAQKPEGVELVITGRRADARVIEAADLVTEMREIKHYYEQGVPCRKGIES